MVEQNEQLVAVNLREARVNVTYAGQNGDLVDTVSVDATDGDVRQWVTEALQSGAIAGIAAQPGVDLTDFVVDRFPPTEARPFHMLQVRPKTPFGFPLTCTCGSGKLASGSCPIHGAR